MTVIIEMFCLIANVEICFSCDFPCAELNNRNGVCLTYLQQVDSLKH